MENKIICADCVEGLQSIDDESVDMVLTSPPYGSLRRYARGAQYDFTALVRGLYRVLKQGGVVVWVEGDQTINGSESGDSFKHALGFMDAGFKLYDTMLYAKRNYIPLTHRRYEQAFEYMFVFSKGRPKTFNGLTEPCKNAGKLEKYGPERRARLDDNQSMRLYGDLTLIATKDTKLHSNIFTYSVGAAKTGHPAAFPDQLAHDMVYTWSNSGDVVLDPFCGSGTTLKASAALKRAYIGIDISQEYCELSKRRVAEAQPFLGV